MFIAFTDVNSTTKVATIIQVDPEKVSAILTSSSVEPGLDGPKLGLALDSGKIIWIVGNMDTVLAQITEGQFGAAKVRWEQAYASIRPKSADEKLTITVVNKPDPTDLTVPPPQCQNETAASVSS